MTKRILIALATLALAGLVAVPALAGDDDQPLGSVAKKKNATKAKVVITDDDITSIGDRPSPESDVKDAKDTKTDTEDSKDDKKADAAPKPTVSALQSELDEVKRDEDMLKRKLQALQKKAEETTDPFRQNMYLEVIENQQVTLKEFRDKRSELEKKIATQKEKGKESTETP